MKPVDSNGSEIQLGPLLHHGGEGTIYEHPHRPGHLIKLYKEPSALKASKLEALIQIGHTAGDKFHHVAIWPIELVYERKGAIQPVGFVMRRVDGVAIHSIYSPKERKHRYPGLTWKNLVLIARNSAAAFHQLHATGAVLGDVNEGNFLVDPKTGLVSLIDCDSFQITHQGQQFLCPVGVGIWTPPELHGIDFKQVPRTTNHDNFGLAVLLFQLLFIGRHPFASPHQGDLEEAIRQRLFSYAESVSSLGITPPPLTIRHGDVGTDVFRLFDRAFLSGSDLGQVIVKCGACGQKNRMPRNASGPIHCGRCSASFLDDWREQRPTAEEWFNALGELETTLVACSTNPLHSHLPKQSCPFCDLDQEGYSAFAFSGFAHKGGLSMEDVVRVKSEIESIQIPVFQGTQTIPLASPLPASPRVSGVNPLYLIGWISAAMAAALFWMELGWPGLIFVAVVVVLTVAVVMIMTGRKTKTYKRLRMAAEKNLLHAQTDVTEAERNLRELLAQRREQLTRIKQKATQAYKNLLEIPVKQKRGLLEIEEQRRPQQLKAHLEKFSFPRYIMDSFKPDLEVKLQAHDIQTAHDVQTKTRPSGIPTDLWTQLSKWSKTKAAEFVFDYQSPASPTALLALNNRLQRERVEEQVNLSDSYHSAKALVAESKQGFETHLAEILNKVRLAREAESQLEALR